MEKSFIRFHQALNLPPVMTHTHTQREIEDRKIAAVQHLKKHLKGDIMAPQYFAAYTILGMFDFTVLDDQIVCQMANK